jgi:nitrite reductase/ring-hydroxylating ferredoxin subunit
MASYLMNCWYVAAYSREITRKPLARTLLGEPLVLYRTQGGDPAVLYDRCPHRFAPLSLGKLVGDEIECGYHGLRFSQAGNCTHNPHSSAIPKAARVRAYPTVERGGFIWYWPGDGESADRRLIPEFGFLDDPAHFSVVRGYIHVACSYQVVVDNLLDLSHTPFLHPQFRSDEVSAEAMLAATTSKLSREESRIFAYRLIQDLPVPAWRREAFDIKSGPVDTRLHMTWFPPALLYFDSGACPKGVPEREGFCAPAAHCITPETEVTSHYFHASGRNSRLNDPEFDTVHLGFLEAAFIGQDEPMLAAVQTRMGTTADLFAIQPVLLPGDGPAVAARRLLNRMITKEVNQAALEKSRPQPNAVEESMRNP